MFIRFGAAWRIIDTDFEEETVFRENMWIADIIVECYEKRELNVAANLALMICNHFQPMGNMWIAIENSRMQCKAYVQYADDVDKYLMLM